MEPKLKSVDVTYDAFYEGMVANGLIIPVGVDGAFGRGAVFERVLEAFDKVLKDAPADAPWPTERRMRTTVSRRARRETSGTASTSCALPSSS